MRVIDAFAGVGGFRVAAQKAAAAIGLEIQVVAAIEFDTECQKVYESNFGDKPLGDITKIDPVSLPDHDLLTGGFPCQPFSRNGKFYNKNNRTLGDDDRSNLFLSLVGILHAKKPKYFVFENVKGLLTMKNKDGTLVLDTILENLRACGYVVQHKVLDSASYGLAQQRERVFFVGVREDVGISFQYPTPTPVLQFPAVIDVLEENVAPAYFLPVLWRNRKVLIAKTDVGRAKVNHPFPAGTPRLEAVTWLYEKAHKPTARTGQIESVAILYGDTPSGLPRQQDKIYSVYGLSPTIATFSTPCFDTPSGFRQLTPRECFRLQGFPDAYKIDLRDSVAYRHAGNAVSVNTVEALLRRLFGLEQFEWVAA